MKCDQLESTSAENQVDKKVMLKKLYKYYYDPTSTSSQTHRGWPLGHHPASHASDFLVRPIIF